MMSVIMTFVYMSMIYFNCIGTIFSFFCLEQFLMVINCYSEQESKLK